MLEASSTSSAVEAGPSYQLVEGIHVIKVKGSFREMGQQHGELLREFIPQGPLPYFRSYMERIIKQSSLGGLAPLVWPLIRGFYGRRIERALPDFARDTLLGLAEGAGISERDMLDACTMPDALLCVVSRLIQLKRCAPAIDHRLALGLGCTSAVAWGDATADGQLLHARNFDYHGVTSWAGTTTVAFHEPDEGHRYVSVCAAGVPLGGVTAMNAAGLTLTVHQHMFTDESRLGGMPVGLVGDIVMREAANLDEAEAILRKHKPIGCWTYVVTDGHKRELLCFEENPRRKVAKRIPTETSRFGYANIYMDKELGETEKNLYPSYWRHNLGRHQRVHSLLDQGGGELDPERMAGILGDSGDSECRLHRSIAMLMTVGSVVFQPESGRLWVATGEAPTSQRRYIGFDLKAEAQSPEAGILDPCADIPKESREAFDAYRDAYLAYFDEGEVGAARGRIDEARRLQPEQSLYHSLGGLLAIQDGDLSAARSAFDRAIELGHPDEERRAAFLLWRGRLKDLAGEREPAVEDYRSALALSCDPEVKTALKKSLKRPYKRSAARKIRIDFTFADVIHP